MSESAEDRMLRDRAERKAASEKAQKDKELARAKADADRKYTNPARREEAQARYKELLSPSSASARPKAAQAPPASGEPLEFHVYKDGELKILKLMLLP